MAAAAVATPRLTSPRPVGGIATPSKGGSGNTSRRTSNASVGGNGGAGAAPAPVAAALPPPVPPSPSSSTASSEKPLSLFAWRPSGPLQPVLEHKGDEFDYDAVGRELEALSAERAEVARSFRRFAPSMPILPGIDDDIVLAVDTRIHTLSRTLALSAPASHPARTAAVEKAKDLAQRKTQRMVAAAKKAEAAPAAPVEWPAKPPPKEVLPVRGTKKSNGLRATLGAAAPAATLPASDFPVTVTVPVPVPAPAPPPAAAAPPPPPAPAPKSQAVAPKGAKMPPRSSGGAANTTAQRGKGVASRAPARSSVRDSRQSIDSTASSRPPRATQPMVVAAQPLTREHALGPATQAPPLPSVPERITVIPPPGPALRLAEVPSVQGSYQPRSAALSVLPSPQDISPYNTPRGSVSQHITVLPPARPEAKFMVSAPAAAARPAPAVPRPTPAPAIIQPLPSMPPSVLEAEADIVPADVVRQHAADVFEDHVLIRHLVTRANAEAAREKGDVLEGVGAEPVQHVRRELVQAEVERLRQEALQADPHRRDANARVVVSELARIIEEERARRRARVPVAAPYIPAALAVAEPVDDPDELIQKARDEERARAEAAVSQLAELTAELQKVRSELQDLKDRPPQVVEVPVAPTPTPAPTPQIVVPPPVVDMAPLAAVVESVSSRMTAVEELNRRREDLLLKMIADLEASRRAQADSASASTNATQALHSQFAQLIERTTKIIAQAPAKPAPQPADLSTSSYESSLDTDESYYWEPVPALSEGRYVTQHILQPPARAPGGGSQCDLSEGEIAAHTGNLSDGEVIANTSCHSNDSVESGEILPSTLQGQWPTRLTAADAPFRDARFAHLTYQGDRHRRAPAVVHNTLQTSYSDVEVESDTPTPRVRKLEASRAAEAGEITGEDMPLGTAHAGLSEGEMPPSHALYRDTSSIESGELIDLDRSVAHAGVDTSDDDQ